MILYDHNVAVPVPWIIMSNYAALISTLHTRNEHSKTIQSQDFATYHSMAVTANLLELVWYFDAWRHSQSLIKRDCGSIAATEGLTTSDCLQALGRQKSLVMVGKWSGNLERGSLGGTCIQVYSQKIRIVPPSLRFCLGFCIFCGKWRFKCGSFSTIF